VARVLVPGGVFESFGRPGLSSVPSPAAARLLGELGVRMGPREKEARRLAEESQKRRPRGYSVGRGVAIPGELIASKHMLPGAVTWITDEATRRIEEKAQAADNRRIEAARDQDVREEKEAKRQARRDRNRTLGVVGASAAAAAVLLRWLGR